MDEKKKEALGLNVAFLLSYWGPPRTGGEKAYANFVDHLRKQGADVRVVGFLEAPSWVRLNLLLTNIWFFRQLVRHPASTVVADFYNYPWSFLCVLLLRVTSQARIVASVRGLHHILEGGRARRLLARTVAAVFIRSCHFVVANSSHTLEALVSLGASPERAGVVNPGIDRPASSISSCPRASSDGRLRLLCAANYELQKGVHILVEAASLLSELDFRLDVIGDPDMEPEYVGLLEGLIDEKGLQTRVTLRGYLQDEDKWAAYADADLFVLPSLQEGYGQVLGEAMLCGLPIVATRVGGIPEVVREGDNALLVPPGEAKALAEAIKRLAGDAALRERMSAASRKRAEEVVLTWEEASARFSRILVEQTC